MQYVQVDLRAGTCLSANTNFGPPPTVAMSLNDAETASASLRDAERRLERPSATPLAEPEMESLRAENLRLARELAHSRAELDRARNEIARLRDNIPSPARGEERMATVFLNALLQQAPAGISITAASGRSVMVNHKAVAILGHNPDGDSLERYGKLGGEHPDGRPYEIADYPTVRALRHGEIVDQEEMVYRRGGDGRRIRLSVSSAPVRDAAGRIMGAVTVFIDIDRQRRAEEMLLRVNERLAQRSAQLADALHEAQQATEAKSRFLAAASHDLRQPLQGTRLFIDTLRLRLQGTPQATVAEKASEALSGAEELLDALLDMSTLDAGVVKVAVRPFRLDGALRRLATEWAGLAAAKGLELRCVPSAVWVHSDPVLLERIVRNLLSNALRYTTRGRVLLGCRRAGHAVRIEVWDTGPGIPPSEQEQVFEDFYQVANTERDRRKGLGLGLAVARRVARLLHHPIGMQSRPGRGSVFFIEVPLATPGAR